ncbi:MAG: PLD nuclease N-terminal domain-containing protein [Actinomycetota bacterium]|nr:PLD nuclease N-terminal domain-containing protein [Actinomycetota bacterium]MDD5666086.1 PLD nuclease N-terminal domain-containing protein [Actinomycetota bacterium]
METWQWAVVLVPLVIIQLSLLIFALVDLLRRERVRGGSKLLWALVIVFINILGPVVYLLWGREAEIDNSRD